MRTEFLRRIPALVFALWTVAAGIIAILRPGQLLEFATIGIVGTAAWHALLKPNSGRRIGIGILCVLLPLTNTWPARIYQSAADLFPVPVPALLSLLSIAAVVGLVAERRGLRLRMPPLLVSGWVLLVLGALVASFASERLLASLGDAWLTLLAPVAVAVIVTSRTTRQEDAWRILSLVVLAALVPLTMAIATYVMSFGIPISGEDLISARLLLFRPHLLQETTFGNIGHLADFVLLLLPSAVFIGARRASPLPVRVIALLAAASSVLVLALILVRSALVIADIALLAMFLLFAYRRDWTAASVPLLGIVALTLVALSPAVRTTYASLVPTISLVSEASPTPHQSPVVSPTGSGSRPSPPASTANATDSPTVVVGPIQVVASDLSERQRIGAIRKAAAVFAEHMPWGVGSGQYDTYDPAHTASHSLLIQILVEDGMLGAAGLVVVCLFVLRESARMLRRNSDSLDSAALRWACFLGAGSFLLQGLIAGAPLAIGSVAVWASLLWLYLAIGSSKHSEGLA